MSQPFLSFWNDWLPDPITQEYFTVYLYLKYGVTSGVANTMYVLYDNHSRNKRCSDIFWRGY